MLFHSKGLNIIGVSLDDDATKWKQAIIKDKLIWNQVSNLKGWEDPIAQKYAVNQIPMCFLIDENGLISHVIKKVKKEGHAEQILSLLGL